MGHYQNVESMFKRNDIKHILIRDNREYWVRLGLVEQVLVSPILNATGRI